MRRLCVGCILLAAIVLLVAACGPFGSRRESGEQFAAAPEITLRLGYGLSTANPRHLTAVAYSRWVYEQTKGKVRIELFPDEVLGTTKEMTDMAVVGNMDMVIVAAGVAGAYEPKLTVIGLPFLFSSPEKVAVVLDGPLGQELAKDLPRFGLRLLAYWDSGFRQITNNRRPIHRPEDMIGLKMRVAEEQVGFSVMRLYGAHPIPLPFPEIYIALSRGEVEGLENAIVPIHSAKFYEVQKYMTVVNYRYESTPLLISEKTWRKLSPETQKVLRDGAVRFAAESRRANQELEEKLLKEMEANGMNVIRPPTEPFRLAAQPIYEEWSTIIGKELLLRIMQEAR